MSNPFGELFAHIRFPAQRDAIVAEAREIGLDPSLIEVLEHLPDHEFDTAAEVALELGMIKL